jgi:hypothetical protein
MLSLTTYNNLTREFNIGFDAFFINAMINRRCKRKECNDLCDHCAVTNVNKSFTMRLPFDFFMTNSPYMFNECQPQKRGWQSLQDIFIFCKASLTFGEMMCDPSCDIFPSIPEFQQVSKGQREIAQRMFLVNHEKFTQEFAMLWCKKSSPLEFLNLMERRLAELHAIFDVASEDILQQKEGHDDWYNQAKERGIEFPNWLHGTEHYYEQYRTRVLIKVTPDMETCRAENLQERISRLQKVNEQKRRLFPKLVMMARKSNLTHDKEGFENWWDKMEKVFPQIVQKC